jgi:hypothetical protein
MVALLGWIVLWFRPRWSYWVGLALAVGLICLALSLLGLASLGALTGAATGRLVEDFAWNAGTFAAIGLIVIAIRRDMLNQRRAKQTPPVSNEGSNP